MTDLPTLIAQRDALLEARASGVRRVVTQTAGVRKEVEYKDDADMVAALASIERQLVALSGSPNRITYVTSKKGFV